MRNFSITVRPYHSQAHPNLKAVLRIRYPSGKVKRKFFLTIKEAEAEAVAQQVAVENNGIRALQLDSRTLLQVLAAIEALKPYGVTIPEAVAYFVEYHNTGLKTVREACTIYIESREKKGVSTRHMDTMRRVFARFTASLGDKPLSVVSPENIEAWLHDLGVAPISINSYRRLLNAVFQYAVHRKMTKENPVAMIELVKEPKAKVGIITPAQMRKLLEAAQGEPDVLATLVLGGFAGLRPEEVARLQWSAINLGSGLIDCAAEITKTAKHRYVKIEPVLGAWLRQPMFVFSSSSEAGKMHIQRENFRRRWDAVRKAAGFAVRGNDDALTNEEATKLAPWPNDALRHSFASYHVAQFEDAPALALQLGHESTKMLFSNYRQRVTKPDAEAWWQLLPKGVL
jgi:integrase